MTQNEMFPQVNAAAFKDGWGHIAQDALGLLPENVESQARAVARHAQEIISEKDAEIERLRRDVYFMLVQHCIIEHEQDEDSVIKLAKRNGLDEWPVFQSDVDELLNKDNIDDTE